MSVGIIINFELESVIVRVFTESLNGKTQFSAYLWITRVKVRCDEHYNTNRCIVL
jgi:hypothetical protein